MTIIVARANIYLYALRNRADLYSKLGDLVEARIDIDAAIQIDPTRSEDFCTRSAIRRRSGDITGAIDDGTEAGIETIALEISDGAIAAIYTVRNPDKLRHLAQ